MNRIIPFVAAAPLALGLACGGETAYDGARTSGALSGACVDDPALIPLDAVRCGEDRVIECSAVESAEFFVTASEIGRTSCVGSQVTLSPAGPYGLGEQVVVAEAMTSSGATTVCTSTITVVDTEAPTAMGQVVEVWPPNHKWVEIDPTDCADWTDTCGEATFRFTSVSVDESMNARGDGNTEPDVEVGCETLRVRAERQGPGDGRIYRVAFEVEDVAGNVSQGTCDVVVPHDQSGRPAVWSGEVDRYDVVIDENGDCGVSEGGGCEGRDIPYDDRLNRGRLPDECTKIEGGDIGAPGVSFTYGASTATITSWRAKDDDPGDSIGFEIALTSTPAWVSVKAGPEVFGVELTGTSTHTWLHPGGTSGRRAKGISNIVVCELEPCDEGSSGGGSADAGVGGGEDAGAGPDAGGSSDAGVSDGGGADAGGGGDAGGGLDAGVPDQGSGF